jgi:hypothetical protein
MKPRFLLLLAVLLGCSALIGCDQRQENNPFIGPSGAANESPFGQAATAPAPTDPHRG